MLQSAMSLAAGVVRTAEGLTNGLKVIADIRARGISVDARGVGYAIETLNMLDVGEAVLQACLERRESRGPHLFFADSKTIVPMERSPKMEKYIVLSLQSGRLATEWREPVRKFE